MQRSIGSCTIWLASVQLDQPLRAAASGHIRTIYNKGCDKSLVIVLNRTGSRLDARYLHCLIPVQLLAGS